MIPIKVLQHGFKLVRATDGSSAFDIVTPVDFVLTKGCLVNIKLCIKSQIPTGKVGLVAPRSGLGSKGVQLRNTVAFIDSDYRGEWEARLTLAPWAEVDELSFKRGERVIQVGFPTVDTVIEYVEEVDETERGERGFNSTGTATKQDMTWADAFNELYSCKPEMTAIQRLRKVLPRATLNHTVEQLGNGTSTFRVWAVLNGDSVPLLNGKPLSCEISSALPWKGSKEQVADLYEQAVSKLIYKWQATE